MQISDLQAELLCTHGPDRTRLQKQLEILRARMDAQVSELWQAAGKSSSVTSIATLNLSDLAPEISQLWQAVDAATTPHTPTPMPAGPQQLIQLFLPYPVRWQNCKTRWHNYLLREPVVLLAAVMAVMVAAVVVNLPAPALLPTLALAPAAPAQAPALP